MSEQTVQWYGSSGRLPRTLTEAPTSKVRVRYSESDHAHVIDARDGVVNCFVNPFALDALDFEYQDLASDAFLRDNVKFTGLKENHDAEEGYRVSSKGFGRALPVLYGEIPYSRMIGGVIVQKGGGISGWMLKNNQDSKDPDGFFGKKEAEKEIEISNLLLTTGARASLVLGYAELNPEWVLSQIQEPFMKKRVKRSLDILKENGDVPVVLFRVDGTTERFTRAGGYAFSEKRFKAELARGSRLLLSEAQQEDSLMQSYLATFEDQRNEVISVLSKLERREKISDEEALLYQRLYVTITARNTIGIFSAKSAVDDDFFPFDMSGSVGKDIDLAHLMKDFEVTLPEVRKEDVIPRYYEYMRKAGENLFLSMKKSSIIDDDFEDWNVWDNFVRLVNESLLYFRSNN